MIYVECNPDEQLVLSLSTISRKEIGHELKGKYELCKQLNRSRNCKAIVDEDPGAIQPKYFESLSLDEDLPEQGLRLLHDRLRGNLVVVGGNGRLMALPLI